MPILASKAIDPFCYISRYGSGLVLHTDLVLTFSPTVPVYLRFFSEEIWWAVDDIMLMDDWMNGGKSLSLSLSVCVCVYFVAGSVSYMEGT